MRGAIRWTLVGALAGGGIGAFCQTAVSQIPADSHLYESFLGQIVRFDQLRDLSLKAAVSRKPIDPGAITLQQIVGLTDQETRILTDVASDCQARVSAFDAQAKPEILRARLDLTESPGDSRATERLKQLQDEHEQVVTACIRELKGLFGDSRFGALDAFVRSERQLASFLPLPKKAKQATPDPVRQDRP
jgi:hypothetical protein